jgi:hypothetical protein
VTHRDPKKAEVALADVVDEADTTLEPGPDYVRALKTHFGIVLDTPYEAIRPARGETTGA